MQLGGLAPWTVGGQAIRVRPTCLPAPRGVAHESVQPDLMLASPGDAADAARSPDPVSRHAVAGYDLRLCPTR